MLPKRIHTVALSRPSVTPLGQKDQIKRLEGGGEGGGGRGGEGGGEVSERLIGGRKGIKRIFDSLVAILVIDVFDSAVE